MFKLECLGIIDDFELECNGIVDDFELECLGIIDLSTAYASIRMFQNGYFRRDGVFVNSGSWDS